MSECAAIRDWSKGLSRSKSVLNFKESALPYQQRQLLKPLAFRTLRCVGHLLHIEIKVYPRISIISFVSLLACGKVV